MARPQIYAATFIEDRGWTAVARVENPSGALITQATVSSIAYEVYNGNTLTASGSITINGVTYGVFDTIQGAALADARWAVDVTGYNFLFEFPGSCFPDHGTDYQVEITFTPSSGEPFSLIYAGPCLELRNS